MFLAEAIDFLYDTQGVPETESNRQRRDTDMANNIQNRKYHFSKVLKYNNVSIKRQVLIKRIGFHGLVF